MTEQVTTGLAEINGTHLYYEMTGTGHPLTLIHGALVDRGLWDDQFAAFVRHFRVIRYDMRGFGKSDVIKAGAPPYSAVADLAGLLHYLNIEKTYVMGLSAGGALAVDFTLAHPEMVDTLITVAAGLMGYQPTTAHNDDLWPQVNAALQQGDVERAVELTLRYFTDGPQRTPEQVNPVARERVRVMTTHNYSRPNDPDSFFPVPEEPAAAGRLSEIAVSTLVVVGDKDVEDVIEIAGYLESNIKGARKVVLPNTAHHPNLEQPAAFNQIVLDFLLP
jgi:pimeloyl-ACP methyl ester carboxylesterase